MATQICPECKSPLRPCLCDPARQKRPRGWNSTLPVARSRMKASTRLRSRSLEEKYGDDPERYGPLFREVRDRMECFGLTYLPGHVCDLGYAPATAHHIDDRGHLDRHGLVRVCGALHDRCEQFPGEVEQDLAAAGSPSLQEIAHATVRDARAAIRGRMTDPTGGEDG